MAGIEAFKKDLEDLGVDVSVYHGVDSTKAATVAVIRIVLDVIEDVEELEAEGWMELKVLVKEIRRIMYVRNIDKVIREPLVNIVENAWENVQEGERRHGR